MEKGLYLVCDGRRVQWDDFEEIREEKVVEVMAEMRGGMGNKKKARKGKGPSEDENPWVTLEEIEQSEPERVGSGKSSAGVAMVGVREALEQLVDKQKGEGGILDRFIEAVAVMEESQREDNDEGYDTICW